MSLGPAWFFHVGALFFSLPPLQFKAEEWGCSGLDFCLRKDSNRCLDNLATDFGAASRCYGASRWAYIMKSGLISDFSTDVIIILGPYHMSCYWFVEAAQIFRGNAALARPGHCLSHLPAVHIYALFFCLFWFSCFHRILRPTRPPWSVNGLEAWITISVFSSSRQAIWPIQLLFR